MPPEFVPRLDDRQGRSIGRDNICLATQIGDYPHHLWSTGYRYLSLLKE